MVKCKVAFFPFQQPMKADSMKVKFSAFLVNLSIRWKSVVNLTLLLHSIQGKGS